MRTPSNARAAAIDSGRVGRTKTVLRRRNFLEAMLLIVSVAILASCTDGDETARRKAWRKSQSRPRR